MNTTSERKRIHISDRRQMIEYERIEQVGENQSIQMIENE